MQTLTVVSSLALFGLLALQIKWVANLSARYRSKQPEPDRACPHVRVILCLRGADPSLAGCLGALSEQTYSNWDLRVVLDDSRDPAADLIERYRENLPNMRVSVISQLLGTCSLKLNALSSELTELPDHCEAVTLIDADVKTYPDWLQDMVAPLADPEVGATTGVRWFSPDKSNPGSCVRMLWNTGAIPQMARFEIPWGGSLAMRADFVREARLADRWSRMIFEDTDLQTVLNEHGRRLVFVPRATMVNTEKTSLRNSFRYIRRQMLNARMYHPRWLRIFLFGIASSLLPLLLTVLAIWSLRTSETIVFQIAGGATAVYLLGMAVLAVCVERIVTAPRRRDGHSCTLKVLKALQYGGLTQLIYFTCLLLVIRQRQIDWRGIEYSCNRDPFNISMKTYTPYRSLESDNFSSIV